MSKLLVALILALAGLTVVVSEAGLIELPVIELPDDSTTDEETWWIIVFESKRLFPEGLWDDE
jgi:hypothetical protein